MRRHSPFRLTSFRPMAVELEARRLLTAYDYTLIGNGILGFPSINNSGEVAFTQETTPDEAARIVRGSGGPLTSLTGDGSDLETMGMADDSGLFDAYFGPRLDDQGSTSFAPPVLGTYSVAADRVTTDQRWPNGSLVDSSGPLSSFRDVDRNAAGVTSYVANRKSGGGVYLDGGTPLFEMFPPYGLESQSPYDIVAPQVNRNGTAVFWTENAIVRAGGGTPPQVVDGDFSGVEQIKISDTTVNKPSFPDSSPTMADIKIGRSGSPWDDREPLVVHYRTESGSAIAGEDFTPVEGDLIFNPVHDAGSSGAQTIQVPILANDVTEGARTFRVVLSLPKSSGLPVATLVDGGVATVTIAAYWNTRDPLPAAGIGVSFLAADNSVNESAGVATASIYAMGEVDGSVTVSYHTEGVTAVAGVDYEETHGSVTLTNDSYGASVPIRILDNTIPGQGRRIVRLVLDGVSSNAAYIDAPEAKLSINEDDGTPSVPQQSAAIDDTGRIAYVRKTDNPQTGSHRQELLVASNGHAPSVYLTSDGPFGSFGSVRLSDAGTIAFYATLDDGGAGIFKGPDPVRDKVIAVGDTLGGFEVTRVDSFDMNDHGQIAFSVTFDHQPTFLNGVYRNDSGAAATALMILVPDAHSYSQRVVSQSAYVGLQGVYIGHADTPILVQALDSGGAVLGSTSTTTDADGRWDVVVLAGWDVRFVRAVDPARPQDGDIVFVSSRRPIPAHPPTDYTKLHQGDLIVSASDSTIQREAYGADATHVSIYVGPDENGTPEVTEAIMELLVHFPNFTGEVVKVPLESSEAYAGRVWARIYERPGLTESTRHAIATFVAGRTGRPYDIESLELMYSMGKLFNKMRGSRRLTKAFMSKAADLRSVIDSRNDFICSTLARTAYLVGAGVDITNPNRTPLGEKSYVAVHFGRKYWNYMIHAGLVVFPDTIASSGVLERIT